MEYQYLKDAHEIDEEEYDRSYDYSDDGMEEKYDDDRYAEYQHQQVNQNKFTKNIQTTEKSSFVSLDGVKDNNNNKSLKQPVCCYKYFDDRAFEHVKKGLIVEGLDTCIHCYISFNMHKYGKDENLTKPEEECLDYYINTCLADHNTKECTRVIAGFECILCNVSQGIYPPSIEKKRKPKVTYEVQRVDDNYIEDVVIVSTPEGSNMTSSSKKDQIVLIL